MPKSTRRRNPHSLLQNDVQGRTDDARKKAKRHRGTTNNSSNFLSQLQTLREFTQGCGSYTERDLSQCLRQSGYNVQVAAERLITGQYVASPTNTSATTASAPVSVCSEKELNATGKAVKKEAVSHLSLTSVLMNANKASDPVQVGLGSSHKISMAVKASSGTNHHGSQYTTTDVNTKNERSDTTILQPNRSQSCGTKTDKDVIPPSGLMLCQRWACGLSTRRNGSIQHNEPVMIFTSSNVVVKHAKGSNIVRFKGDNIEGTLDNHLSSFLSPLLRVQNESGNDNETALIGIVAKGLMEDNRIDIGMEVPLELNVFILRPQEFFSLFDEPVGNALTRDQDAFWAVQKSGKIPVMAKAAFDLLQWAQYSSLPKFHTNNIRGDDDDDKENGQSNSGDEKDDVDKADNGNDEHVAEEETPDWVQNLYSKHEPSSKEDEKVADPQMLNEKGIHLRCYQRQALNWMIYREESTSEYDSKEFKEHFDLLSELSSIKCSPVSSVCDAGDSELEVQCIVGPVKVSREYAEKSKTLDGNLSHVSHPLWQKRFLWSKGIDGNGKDIYSFYVNELLQIASKTPPNPPKQCRGGILADSMGLGKTVMLMALIAKDVETQIEKRKNKNDASCKFASNDEDVIHIDDENEEKEKDSIHPIQSEPTTTLVVTPLSLLSQWEDEILSKSNLSCLIYYGDQAKRITADDISRVDILITTYGMLQSEYVSKREKKAQSSTLSLFSLSFRRVILDEAHFIKNPNTGASKACCMIKAERRWCVTGTPISNSLQDVFGLIKFLKHEPWCVPRFWKKAVESAKRVNKENDGTDNISDEAVVATTSMERVRRVLKPILLRRTKDTLSSDGKPILTLPPVETKLITVHLSEEERFFYNVLLSRSQNVFEGYIQSGTATKSWFAIFALLQRLRQSCDHLALTVQNCFEFDTDDESASNSQVITENQSSNDTFIKQLLESVKRKKRNDSTNECCSQAYSEKIVDSLTQCIQNNGALNEECAICLEIPPTSDLALTPCSHIFCRTCLLDSLERKKSTSNSNFGQCPICAMEVADLDVLYSTGKQVKSKALKNLDSDTENFDARLILESALQGKCSSKMLAILHELEAVWQEDPGSKVLIFSQYLGMFDLLQKEFARQGITAFRLDGKMSLNDRRQTVKQFNTSRVLNNGTSRKIVLLASMKACGVGMNLTAASTVFIVDPWWNDAMESQCINRIHRIGQTAPLVKVRKFIVSDSVEEKIVKMQHRKQGMANEVLSEESTTSKKTNPTLDDLKAIFAS